MKISPNEKQRATAMSRTGYRDKLIPQSPKLSEDIGTLKVSTF